MRDSLVIGVDGAYGKPCSIAVSSFDFENILLYRTGKVMTKKKLVEMGENVPSYRTKALQDSYLEVLDRIYTKHYYNIGNLFFEIELPTVMGMGNTAANLGLSAGIIAASSLIFTKRHKINTKINFVAPTSWRKLALGRGNVKKKDVPKIINHLYKNINYVNEISPNAKINDDDWDAVGICIYGALKNRSIV